MKYLNKKVTVDNIVFDSKKEATRYQELVLLQKFKKISQLILQPQFQITINDIKVCKYIADFSYLENGELVVEDVKSEYTRGLPLYRLKKKLMKAALGIEIKEI